MVETLNLTTPEPIVNTFGSFEQVIEEGWPLLLRKETGGNERLELGENNNKKIMVEHNLSKLFSQTPMFTIKSIAYLTMQLILLIPTQVLIMNVSPIMALPAGNVLRISCWNITKWWSNVTLLTITQSICDDTPPIPFPKNNPKKTSLERWKITLSSHHTHKNPPTFSLLPKTSVIPCNLYHSIYFNYLPLISSRTPTPNNHPSEEAKKKTKKNLNPLLPSPSIFIYNLISSPFHRSSPKLKKRKSTTKLLTLSTYFYFIFHNAYTHPQGVPTMPL